MSHDSDEVWPVSNPSSALLREPPPMATQKGAATQAGATAPEQPDSAHNELDESTRSIDASRLSAVLPVPSSGTEQSPPSSHNRSDDEDGAEIPLQIQQR